MKFGRTTRSSGWRKRRSSAAGLPGGAALFVPAAAQQEKAPSGAFEVVLLAVWSQQDWARLLNAVLQCAREQVFLFQAIAAGP
jgi:hypothetical protein